MASENATVNLSKQIIEDYYDIADELNALDKAKKLQQELLIKQFKEQYKDNKLLILEGPETKHKIRDIYKFFSTTDKDKNKATVFALFGLYYLIEVKIKEIQNKATTMEGNPSGNVLNVLKNKLSTINNTIESEYDKLRANAQASKDIKNFDIIFTTANTALTNAFKDASNDADKNLRSCLARLWRSISDGIKRIARKFGIKAVLSAKSEICNLDIDTQKTIKACLTKPKPNLR